MGADDKQAVQRDLKNYIKNHADRTIPVGYSAADVREILQDTWAYLQCAHDDDQSSSDFFGLNSYSWCGGDATFESAQYDVLVDMFKNSSIPVFFSEYGCNEVKPRVFDEVQALYGEQMTVLSGGLVYEYSQEESDYGLAIINDNGTVTLRVDYDNLQEQFNKLDMARIESLNPTATSIDAPECTSRLITNQAFDTNFTIPDVCPGCADLIENGIDNPTRGQLVEVTATEAPNAIYGSTGTEVEGLTLKLLPNDEANGPSGETTSPSGTGTGSAAEPSKTGAASKITGGWGLLVAVFFALLTAL